MVKLLFTVFALIKDFKRNYFDLFYYEIALKITLCFIDCLLQCLHKTFLYKTMTFHVFICNSIFFIIMIQESQKVTIIWITAAVEVVVATVHFFSKLRETLILKMFHIASVLLARDNIFFNWNKTRFIFVCIRHADFFIIFFSFLKL